MSAEDFKTLREALWKQPRTARAALERLEGAMQVTEARAESLDLVLERTKAQAAAMREALERGASALDMEGGNDEIVAAMRAALASGAGAALLAERNTLREQLATTHAQVAEVARLLDPEVCPDAWGLHAAAQKVLAERDALRGQLATEEAERIRCRDGWAAASTEVERLRAEATCPHGEKREVCVRLAKEKVAQARREERERCVQVAETLAGKRKRQAGPLVEFAAAIRALGDE